jgi:hypothetical protein
MKSSREMTNNSCASNSGMVVSVRGSVVDMCFDALLRAGEKNQIVIEVLAINPLLEVLPRAGFIWLLTGGILYSSGIVFYALDHRYPGCTGRGICSCWPAAPATM